MKDGFIYEVRYDLIPNCWESFYWKVAGANLSRWLRNIYIVKNNFSRNYIVMWWHNLFLILKFHFLLFFFEFFFHFNSILFLLLFLGFFSLYWIIFFFLFFGSFFLYWIFFLLLSISIPFYYIFFSSYFVIFFPPY